MLFDSSTNCPKLRPLSTTITGSAQAVDQARAHDPACEEEKIFFSFIACGTMAVNNPDLHVWPSSSARLSKAHCEPDYAVRMLCYAFLLLDLLTKISFSEFDDSKKRRAEGRFSNRRLLDPQFAGGRSREPTHFASIDQHSAEFVSENEVLKKAICIVRQQKMTGSHYCLNLCSTGIKVEPKESL